MAREDYGVRISRLIRFGHRWEDIQNYTLPQIQLFLESAIELEAEERRNRLLETAIAAQGSKESVEDAVKKLGG